MTDKLRIGFAGCGSHATANLYPCLQYAPVRLVAVCDLNEDRRAHAQRHFGAGSAFASVDELLNGPELDAVLVCGPPEFHHGTAMAALDKGLHVFVEKPPAPDLKAAQEMREAARQNQRLCQVGFMKRFALRYQEAKHISARAQFGQISQISIKYSHSSVPNLRYMPLYMTIHCFDLIRYFVGDLARITVESRQSKGQYNLAAVGTSRRGALVTLQTNSQEPRMKEIVEIIGEGEMLTMRNVIELEYHHRVDPSRAHYSGVHDIEVVRPDFAVATPNQNSLFLQGYAGQINAFARSCIENRPAQVSIDDGVEAMKLVELFSQGSCVTMDL
ncbi:MAG: Gfo/Idh/MocA family oxidoreductase [Candidatus Hydrogenedentes bacterium]|nr:Gfo/Idh/MocA family oxidoreductase [Candidatus Hydrogenedentota bacterium]